MSFDTTRIQMLVDKVQDFLGGWLEQKLKAIHPNGYWQSAVLAALDERQRKIVKEDGSSCPQELDLPMQVSVFRYNWPSLLETFHLNRQLYNDAVAVKQIRNKYDHKKRNAVIDWERYHHDIETIYLFLKELKAGEKLLDEVREILSEAGPLGQKSSPCVPNKPTFKITVSSPPLPLKQVPTQKAVDADISPTVAPRPMATKTITTQEKSNGNPVNCDIAHVYECKNYLDMAREVFPQYFDSSSLIISSADRETSPVQGKSAWDYLVLLHCKSDHQEACRSINSFYQCMDTTPYVQDEYIVWQFPRYVEQALEDYNVADIYPIGVLPSMFDDFISSKEGTSYCPDAMRVEHNDNATEKDALWYLGNYFPRSFAETFCIFDFALPYALEKIIGGRDELSICDVGVGSGGATLGLIWALRKYLSGKGIKRIRLYGFDINEHALNLFSRMLPLMKREWPIDFDVTLRKTKFTAVKIIPANVIDRKVDFVITSKCLQEVASRISVSIEQIYNRFIEDARSVVSSKGLVAIMEIARPFRSSSLNKALSGIGPELATLIPNGEGMPIVGEERFELNSSRIGRIVGENLLFSVIGDKSFKEEFPEWVPAPKPILNEQDVDSEREESEIQREG